MATHGTHILSHVTEIEEPDDIPCIVAALNERQASQMLMREMEALKTLARVCTREGGHCPGRVLEDGAGEGARRGLVCAGGLTRTVALAALRPGAGIGQRHEHHAAPLQLS